MQKPSKIDELKGLIKDSENIRRGNLSAALGKRKEVAKKMTKGERMIANAHKKGKSIFPYSSTESYNDTAEK
jgi:hypothetical protein